MDDQVDAAERFARRPAPIVLPRPALQTVAHDGATDPARRGQSEARVAQLVVDKMHREELAATTPAGAVAALVVDRAPEPLAQPEALPLRGPDGHEVRR